jgi:hypothetical protein
VACIALLGKQFAEAVRTVGMLVSRRESLTCQRRLTIGAREAFSVIGLILVGDAALRDHLGTLGALGGEVVLVAWHTVDLTVLGYEALAADGHVTREAEETVLVKLLSFVFHLFHARFENLSALVASSGERLIIALATVERIVLGAERLVNQRYLANMTEEAFLVPMLLFVRQIFRIGADFLLAFLAVVSEQLLVAFNAVRMLVL